MSTQTVVRERPILFSGPMVRAILDGKKTQTRRVVVLRGEELCSADRYRVATPTRTVDCPFGMAGDRLYVRETWARENDIESEIAWLHYRATPHHGIRLQDRAHVTYLHESRTAAEVDAHVASIRWKPSIHMPREYARLSLEVTRVRVERLRDISEADAVAEGAADRIGGAMIKSEQFGMTAPFAVYNYALLWDSLNAPRGYGWEVNPWVWVIEFRRVTP
jgi:hypothetical protein